MNKLNKIILSNKNGCKSASGITLIALVITIIVLLILAGVTIAMLTGSDSAPAKANDAKQKNDIGSARDQVYLFASNAQTEAYETVYVKGKKTDNSGEDVTAGGASTSVSDYVKRILKNEYPENGTKKVGLATIVATNNGGTITISTTDWKQEGTVSNTGGTLTWKDLTQNIPTPAATPLEIGQDVGYSTTLNGVTLKNWKVFLSDKNDTYLIYGDYLPSAAVSITNIETYGTYGVYTEVDKATFINAMTTPSNWSALINNGSINGTALSSEVKNNVNVTAMGAPTVDLWVNSWNAKYQSDTLYTRYVDTEDIDNNNFFTTGYAIGDSANPTTLSIGLSSKTGYSNTLYFPHQEWIEDGSSCYGYWLASPHAGSNDWYSMMIVNYDGNVGNLIYDGDYAFRPVIKLPTSVLNQ